MVCTFIRREVECDSLIWWECGLGCGLLFIELTKMLLMVPQNGFVDVTAVQLGLCKLEILEMVLVGLVDVFMVWIFP